jgi:predicted DNA-binding transcriptional regulator AlpA
MPSTKPSKKSQPRRHAPMPYIVSEPDNVEHGDQSPAPRPKYIFKPEVLKLVGYTFPTLWLWMREDPPRFPLSFVIGSKTAWLESKIDAWLASRPRSTFKTREG